MSKLLRLRPVHTVLLLIGAVALLVSGCATSTTDGSGQAAAAASGSGSSSSSSSSSSPSTSAGTSRTAAPTKPVHISLLNADGSVFGVGMPEIAYFSRKITNAKPLQDATTVTVNGKPAKGAWDFEYSSAQHGPIEGHFRLQHYWPAHSKIHIGIAAKGLSAGRGLTYDDSLTSDWSTGAANISTVDNSTHMITVVSDGKTWGKFPVSLGASDTPTARGIKVIMEKGRSICMHGPTYHECGVKYTQRLTYGGEYLHSAPWNCTGSTGCVGPLDNIGSADSSNGCTNLRPTDAIKLYGFLGIGDVVMYPNATGPQMQLGQGYGDWNVPWASWQTGGLVPTS